jgi:hypothetical protein
MRETVGLFLARLEWGNPAKIIIGKIRHRPFSDFHFRYHSPPSL